MPKNILKVDNHRFSLKSFKELYNFSVSLSTKNQVKHIYRAQFLVYVAQFVSEGFTICATPSILRPLI